MWLTHPGCDGWEQRGEQTSHCANCHQTFTSLIAFDAHQAVLPDRTQERSGVLCVPADQDERFVAVRADAHTKYWGRTVDQKGYRAAQWRETA